MSLHDFFERIHIVNLRYKKNRKRRLSSHLIELGLADPKQVRWNCAVSGDHCWAPSYFRAGNGAWGCLQSHIRIAQDAIADNLENYLVLEDDVVFLPEWKVLLEMFVRQLPSDWGQVYLGGQHLKSPTEVPEAPFVFRGVNINRTHAFAVQRRTLPVFLRHICEAKDYMQHDRGWHIDHQLGVSHESRNWNVYCPRWWIAGQEAGESNVSGRNNPRYWWQYEGYSKYLPFVWLHPDVVRSRVDCGNSIDVISKRVHFGNNLIEGLWQDIGLEECFASHIVIENNSVYSRKRILEDVKLRKFLEMIAREAMSLGKLPGLQHPEILIDLLEMIWGVRVIDAMDNDLEAFANYPFNGLIPDLVNEVGLDGCDRS